jgi:hypothetical protein|nr:MAG TPA: hypothetical protein [Inoviridae sp.]
MHKLEDCSIFKARVEEENGKFYVIVLGKDHSFEMFCDFEVEKKKEFESKQLCMDFLIDYTDYGYKFVAYDFEFASHRYFLIDYLGCGVDFDED